MTLAILILLTLVTVLSVIGLISQLPGIFSAETPQRIRALVFLCFAAFMAMAVSGQWDTYLE
jgi:hypothetical protein